MTTEQMTDPKDAGQKPPFPSQEQEHPGIQAKMSPKPDSGEGVLEVLSKL